MNLENGVLYTAIALVFFYLYLAWLRGRKRRLARETAVKMSKAHGAKKKELAARLPDPNAPRYQVRSWPGGDHDGAPVSGNIGQERRYSD